MYHNAILYLCFEFFHSSLNGEYLCFVIIINIIINYQSIYHTLHNKSCTSIMTVTIVITNSFTVGPLDLGYECTKTATWNALSKLAVSPRNSAFHYFRSLG